MTPFCSHESPLCSVQELQDLPEDELRGELRSWLHLPLEITKIHSGTSLFRAVNEASTALGFNCRQVIFELHSVLPIWKGTESRSGIGSELSSTLYVRHLLPGLLSKYAVKSVLDAGCGDFNWARGMDWNSVQYTGVDIVSEIISDNRKKFSSATVRFVCADITQDNMPKVEAILCRDCLFHFSPEDVINAVINFKRAGARYLLTSTFQSLRKNRSIPTGDFHPINLQLAPYNFPVPLESIPDSPLEKSLALWRLSEIKTP